MTAKRDQRTLSPIGAHVRSLARKPGLSPLPLAGSTPVNQAPVRFKKKGGVSGDVDYSHAKLTICSAPEHFGPAARIYVDPSTRIAGGFRDLGPGRYL